MAQRAATHHVLVCIRCVAFTTPADSRIRELPEPTEWHGEKLLHSCSPGMWFCLCRIPQAWYVKTSNCHKISRCMLETDSDVIPPYHQLPWFPQVSENTCVLHVLFSNFHHFSSHFKPMFTFFAAISPQKHVFPCFFNHVPKKTCFFLSFPHMLWLNFCNFPRKSGVLDCLAFFSMVFPSFFQPFRGLGGRWFRRFRGDSEHRQRLRRAFGARALATVLHLDEGRGTAKAHGPATAAAMWGHQDHEVVVEVVKKFP